MKKMLWITLLCMAGVSSFSQAPVDDIEAKIIALEKGALEKWNRGNPNGYLDLYANDIVYFDPETEQRLEGLEAMKNYYEPIRGLIRARYEMPNPKVQAVKEMAVLTFNLFSYSEGKVVKWNCTEVYRLEKSGQWKIIQSHWSYIKPDLK